MENRTDEIELYIQKMVEESNQSSILKKHLLLIDEFNLQRINNLIEKYESHLEKSRQRYKNKHNVSEQDTRKNKTPISYKIMKSF
jgi:hypothetical protein